MTVVDSRRAAQRALAAELAAAKALVAVILPTAELAPSEELALVNGRWTFTDIRSDRIIP
jgi:hypothetical protein